MVDNSLLKIIQFSETKQWDVKYFYSVTISSKYHISTLGEHIIRINKKTKLSNDPEKEFKILGISNEVGMFDAYHELGKNINQPYIFVENGCLAYNPYRINVGSIGLKTSNLKNEYISPAYIVFKCKSTLLPEYLYLVMKSSTFNYLIRNNTTGSVRQTLSFDNLAKINIPIPDLSIQKQLVEEYNSKMIEFYNNENLIQSRKLELEKYVFSELGIKNIQIRENNKLLQVVSFKDVHFWGYDKLICKLPYVFEKYKAYNFNNKPSWIKELFRGKSPKYKDSDIFILNQKCNRINNINLSYAKSVDEAWIKSINEKFLTRENDILINSTGEGTIGRASLIKKDFEGFAYDSHVLLLRVNLEEVNPAILVYLINSKYGKKQVEMYKGAQATKQTELGIENVKKLLFPLPSIEKQNILASYIEKEEKEIQLLNKKNILLKDSSRMQFEREVFNET